MEMTTRKAKRELAVVARAGSCRLLVLLLNMNQMAYEHTGKPAATEVGSGLIT